MIKHVCTACTVKIYRFAADARACPVCSAPMVVAPRAPRAAGKPVPAPRTIAATRRPRPLA